MDSIETPSTTRPISTPIDAMDGLSVEVMMYDPSMDTGGHVMDSGGMVLPSTEVIPPADQQEPTSIAMETGGLAQLRPGIMDSGNHSSEEELEEYYLSPVVSGTEKRKWSDLSQSEESCCSDAGHTESTDGTGSSSSTTPESGEEDVNHNIPTSPPNLVQFSKSPPADVHKPRRSISPQQKLFSQTNQEHPFLEEQANEESKRPNRGSSRRQAIVRHDTSMPPCCPSRHDSLMSPCCPPRHDSVMSPCCPPFSSSLPPCLPSARSMSDIPALVSQEERRKRRAISPRKRSRTSRVCHIQRPCLDFEKMQQIKKRVVTSWRPQGAELSLFCW